MTLGDLTTRLRDIFESRKDKTMFIAGAESLRYGDIIGVIDAAKGAGVLLVIFMAALPLTQRGMDINLPAETKTANQQQEIGDS